MAPVRNPVPEDLQGDVIVLGSDEYRVWARHQPRDLKKILLKSHKQQIASGLMYDKDGKILDVHLLAISGGGDKGAFTAGLLAGWTEAGTRPEFLVVTGISTGALIAPFAFLGPDYDDTLRELYTKFSTKDLAEQRSVLSLLVSDSVMDVTPFKEMLARYVDEELLRAVAREHNRGRLLLIGTTNLDADLPVIWNMGAIANSGHPDALELFRKIMIASASIPLIFPPVYIEVEADDQVYDEIHVDGGTASQVFVYPVRLKLKEIAQQEGISERKRHAYIIRNAELFPKWQAVEPGIVSIGGRSLSMLIKTQGLGDIYRIYWTMQRDGVDFNFAYVPEDFKEEPKEMFDKEYMKKLYKYGYEKAKHGYPWLKAPPTID
ncbi:MAG: patatin-like phospholipase family protein [Gammaproteobacteria bacterium]|nr:patatin-like phospholipase family protein [Gammaproteobacteria bacterium]